MMWNKIVVKSLATVVIAAQVLYPSVSFAEYTSLNILTAPLYVNSAVKASVMLDISKDNQLYYKAFNDYSDLDGLPGLETTYTHGVDYYGYFDSYKCYDYTAGRFVPVIYKAKNKALPDNDPFNLTQKKCGGGRWAGNFLNWVSMSRMDAVRKLLYGGLRSVDTSTETVLERAFLPTDAHSWAKYYNGSDMADLTPYSPLTTAPVYDSASMLEVLAPQYNVFSVTRSGTTATVSTLAVNHGFNVGQQVSIFGALNDNAYNGVKTITSIAGVGTAGNPYRFTFDIVNTAATPATGKINVFPRNPVVITGAGTYPVSAGDQLRLVNGANVIEATVVSSSSAGANPSIVIEHTATTGSGTFTGGWKISNLNSTGISFCNTTAAPGYTGTSQALDTNTYPPLMRVAKGNFSLWSANERWQCSWFEERNNLQGGFAGGFLSNGNRAAQSGINASAENPSNVNHRLAGTYEFNVRVQACVPGTPANPLLGEERCKKYDAGANNYKPVGLLQIYGDVNLINFGLFTGSYDKNISGGVLRKNVGTFNDEVRADISNVPLPANRDGTFTFPAAGGIIDTMNRLRIYGYRYNDGSYISPASATGDDCPYQIVELKHSGALASERNEGNCSTWGNPMSEIFLESIRYLAGKAPTATFQQSGGGKDATLGLREAAWVDPVSQQNFCTPLNVLLFNTASPSYDDDQLAGLADINGGSAVAQTNRVGDNEGITGNYFVGNVGTATLNGDSCIPKAITGQLGAVSGICPEAASYNGSYLMAGVALSAHTIRIRTDVTIPALPAGVTGSNDFRKALKVDTYGVALSPTVPKIDIPIPGSPTNQKVVLMPAYRLDLGTNKYGGGSIVDFKVVRQDLVNGTGRFYVNWEDSGFGGDFDQDVIGIIDYCIPTATNGGCRVVPQSGVAFNVITPGTLVITTDVISAATANPQGFGYIISGTDQDGVHFHSGIYGFNYPTPAVTPTTPVAPNNLLGNVALDSTGVIGCNNCNITDAPTSWIYRTSTTASAKVLQDPLYYAAKYGAFTDADNDGMPSNANKCEWDSKDAFGNRVAGCPVDSVLPSSGADGIPDTFYYVTNPNALESALDRALVAILGNSSASSVAANSTSLRAGTRIYQATFNPNSWTGSLVAYNVNLQGVIQTPAAWDAGLLLRPSPAGILDANTRTVITNQATGRNGVAFRWTSLDSLTQTRLNMNPGTLLADALGQRRLDYLRGSEADESNSSTGFRERQASKLGDIVNSNPVFVGPPDAGYADPTYQTFRTSSANAFRKSVVYVAGNDGMVHGFCADASGGICTQGGKEILAYVPSMVHTFPTPTDPGYSRLSKLTQQGYKHDYYVDGTPTVTDAKISGTWKTVLVGGVGSGNTGYYALDVTNPDNFSEANAASLLLWEIRRSDDINDLGVSTSQPVVVKMANDRFAAVFGNGYNSKDGKAAVYVAFLDSGGTWNTSNLIKIPLANGPDNGASSPTVIDPNFNGTADAIYVGTLKGEMYKIDVSSTNPSDWSAAASKTLLFRARDGSGNVQPITSAPEVTRHPEGGYLVLFGTGQYLTVADTVSAAQQTFYGVRDNGAGTLLRSDLFARTMGAVTVLGTGTFRSVSTLPNTGTDNGWRLDLSLSKERIVYPPQLAGGKVVFVTLIPSGDPCAAGGTSYLFELDPITGAQLPDPVYDVNNDGIIDPTDATYAGRASTVGITPNPTFIGGATTGPVRDNPRKFLSGSTGNVEVVQNVPGPGSGRLSWRELLRD